MQLDTLRRTDASLEIPSNMFLNYSGKPSLYLPSCMIVWGVISSVPIPVTLAVRPR